MIGTGLVLLSACLLGQSLAEPYCYSEDQEPYQFFGTKTIYDLVRNKKIQNGVVPNCKAVLVWGLFRHGTRYPHEKEIKRLKDLPNLKDAIIRNDLTPNKDKLCYEDVELLRNWNLTVKLEDADLLSSTGVTESFLLAKRLKTDFPVLDAPYTEDKFKIRFTNKIRTKQTAESFTMGLFGTKVDFPDSFVDSTLLEPSTNCSTWKKSTHSEGAEKQMKAFREGFLMKELISSVSKRLGFSYDLPYNTIDDMYTMCRFDKAWNPKMESPWCSAFTKEHLQVLEFNEDLEYYYDSGYGNPFTTMLGCPLVRDLIETLNNRTQMNETDEAGLSGVLYFAHSLTVRSALVKLGMARDNDPITAENFHTSGKRQWRTSFINPFAANLLAVLYKCTNDDKPDDYKVMFYLNEQYVDYAGCKVGLCDWSYIYERFAPNVNPASCNLNFCSPSSSTLTLPSFLLISALSMLVLSPFLKGS